VVLVNLPQALVVDQAALEVLGYGEPRVLALRAEETEHLSSLPLTGAVNLSSMQEMDDDAIRGYFSVLRRAPSPRTWFYCQNAVEKRWADGTVRRFHDYPWRDGDRRLVDGQVPWMGVAGLDGPVQTAQWQRLVWLEKGDAGGV